MGTGWNGANFAQAPKKFAQASIFEKSLRMPSRVKILKKYELLLLCIYFLFYYLFVRVF